MSAITVIVPAHNEAEQIGTTLQGILERRRHHQVIVVDDGSQDQTPEIAASLGVHLVRLPKNVGKAKAVEAGLSLATGEIIVLLDADLGPTARYWPRLVEPLLTGEAQMAVALLTSPAGTGGMGFVRKLANWGLYFLTGQRFPAVLSGQRAFFQADLPKLLPLGSGFGLELALTVRAIRGGLTLAQVPLPIEHDYTGRDWAGFAHRSRQFRDIFQTILWLRRDGKP
ncbi:MAG: glycosyltransferase family 2 protein [Firmicutes bacterium]|nr:glycosyltransferase family 2 protein [Bacillota bacterium]